MTTIYATHKCQRQQDTHLENAQLILWMFCQTYMSLWGGVAEPQSQ